MSSLLNLLPYYQRSEEWLAGHFAYYDLQFEHDNPFREGSKEHSEWLSGFRTAVAEDRD